MTASNIARTSEGPQTTTPLQRLPQGLRDRPQWCIAGPDKRPVMVDGRAASVTDPSTWSDFADACDAAATRGWSVGYVIHEADPYACIDMDVKDDTPADLVDRFEQIAEAFDSYTERSRSGRGLHVWVEAGIGRGRRREGIEVYSQERFIICTGDVTRDRPIANRQEMLANMVSQMPTPSTTLELSGENVCDFALASRAVLDQGELGRLFRGDWEQRYPSQSEADLALVKLLLPHVDSLRECWLTFQLSALGQRDKAKRSDYAQSTISLAVQHLANDAAQLAHGKQLADGFLWVGPVQHDQRYFRLLCDDDLRHLAPQRWLVKGIIPETGIGTIFGQSGTFKSFLALDLLAHVANGQQWLGRKVTWAPAVYVPFEGQGGIPKRVAAWKQALAHRNITASTNMRFITEPMNLRQKADRDKLVATLVASGWAGGILCIDTLAQAGPGIDENTSQGMGEMIDLLPVFWTALSWKIPVMEEGQGKRSER